MSDSTGEGAVRVGGQKGVSMLKTIVLSCCFAAALSLSPAFAQNTSPPADQSAPPAADQGAAPAAPAAPAAGGKQTNKEIMASCRADAKSKGLKGPEFKSSVHDCVAAQKPKLAARMECRQQGKAAGKSGDDLKAFVKDCMAKGQQ
jgi:hypothetical protein